MQNGLSESGTQIMSLARWRICRFQFRNGSPGPAWMDVTSEAPGTLCVGMSAIADQRLQPRDCTASLVTDPEYIRRSGWRNEPATKLATTAFAAAEVSFMQTNAKQPLRPRLSKCGVIATNSRACQSSVGLLVDDVITSIRSPGLMLRI